MPRNLCALSLALLLPLTAACGVSRQYFRPTEKTGTESITGRPAAEYEVVVGEQRWGEVRVWSDRAETRSQDGVRTTSLHVGLEIENALDEGLELDLDNTRLEAAEVGDLTLEPVPPSDVSEPTKVDARNVWTVDLEFPLPDDVTARDLKTFRIRWQLRGPDGKTYEQHTGFRKDRSYPHYYWHPSPWRYGVYWSYGPAWCW